MPTKNPRLLVTLEPLLYRWVKKVAQLQGVSMSLALRDIVKKEYQEENWYWAKSWQEAEREADEDVKKKRFKNFENIENLIKDLKA